MRGSGHSGSSDRARAGTRGRTSLAIAINAGALVLAIFIATEWFIARKARTTLLYEPNAAFRQELAPNQHLQREGASYIIGAHGMRGEPPRVPRPAETTRVMIAGGSSVFDYAVEPSWPERIEGALRKNGLAQVEVLNAGVPGFSTREVIPFFEQRIAKLEPSVVALYAGWNDAKIMRASLEKLTLEPYPSSIDDPYLFLRAPRPLRNFYALPVMFEKLRLRASAPPIAVEEGVIASAGAERPSPPRTIEAWRSTPGLQYWRENLHRFVRAVRAANATPIFIAETTLVTATLADADRKRVVYAYVDLDHDALVALNEALVSVMAEVAQEEQIDFLDPRPELNGRSELFIDHVHLTERGSAALAETLAPALEKIILRR